VQAVPAQPVLVLDKGNPESQLGGDAGNYQTADPTAQNEQIALDSLGHTHPPCLLLSDTLQTELLTTEITEKIYGNLAT
jgi:hypothetical protein